MKVSEVPLLLMPPVNANIAVALVEVIVGVPAAATVMVLPKVSVLAAAVESVKAAVPASESALLLASVAPPKLSSKVVPVAKAIVPPLALPSALALVILKVPALMAVFPV